MTELRWILLVAGLALIAGMYLWGIRSRSRSAAVDPGRATTVEPGRRPVLPSGADDMDADVDTDVGLDSSMGVDVDVDTYMDSDAGIDRTAGRLEPRIRGDEPVSLVHDVVPRIDVDVDGLRAGRREPTLGQRRTITTERGPEAAEPHAPTPVADLDSQTAVEARAQRIVALRVVAPLPSRFEGSLLQEALLAEHFEFGRYEIFHRLDPSGRPLISLASLREPGTFDPATMAGAAYSGVALFAVLPGPLTAQQAFEQLFATARSLAARLGGHVQDERGVPLTAQRVVRLREDMLAFDRGRADPERR
jgi:cell division protein ZipA